MREAPSALHDGVRSSLHVAKRGCGAVPWLGGFAGGARVGGVEPNAVGPAVIDGGTIGQRRLIGNSGGGKRNMGSVVVTREGVVGFGCGDGVGALKTSL